MSLLPTIGAVDQDTGFYKGVATTSLRFNRADSPELSYTPSASNRKTYTLSVWVKLSSQFDQYRAIFGAGGGSTRDRLQLFNNQQLAFNINDGTDGSLATNRLFRDPTAWYHIVAMLDTTQATNTNRMKLYVNGTEQTYSATTYPDEDYEGRIGTNIEHFIGNASSDALYMDGYLAEFNYTDGVANTASAFGETKNGVWIPKAYTGSYGQNGFRMKFDQVGVGTAGTTTIGADTSGLTNHLTSTNIVASDCAMPDSPENNFAIANSADFRRAYRGQTNPTTEGGLKFAAQSDANNSVVQASMPINQVLSNGGGVYWEVRVDSGGAGNNSYAGLLVDNNDNEFTADTGPNTWPKKTLIDYLRGYFYYDGSSSDDYRSVDGVPYVADDIIGFAVKSDGKFFMHKNGTYFNQLSAGAAQNPATGANPITTLDLAVNHVPAGDGQAAFHFNFGQDSTFAGAISAGGEADANGIGDFAYAVPTGFLALCTANMSEPTIGPNSSSQATDYFNTVLYTGNSTDDRAITGVGFKPDWCWFKKRATTNAMSHYIVDSARGTSDDNGTGTIGGLQSNGDNAEVRTSDGGFASFDDDGFTLGQAPPQGGYPHAGYERNNRTGDAYVAWNWKANGGTATATISESGDNPAAVVQANATAGFSLITYTGTGDAGTIAHGLGAVPTMMIIKNRDVADAWAVYHGANTAAPATDYLVLNTTAATADAATYWADTAPTSSVFTVHDAHNVNADGEKYVAYVFADVEGFSKMGSYTGNGSASGTYVNLGFRPAWIMFKRTDSSSGWHILDNKRAFAGNEIDVRLEADNSDAEGTGGPPHTDFLSNGFKLRTSFDNMNATGGTYIYMAFAEAPFKYANAR